MQRSRAHRGRRHSLERKLNAGRDISHLACRVDEAQGSHLKSSKIISLKVEAMHLALMGTALHQWQQLQSCYHR